jgi:type I restriction enzyme S subunit
VAGAFLGKSGLVTADMLPANTNQALAIIRLKKEIAAPRFIHYFLRQKSTVEFVNNMSGQSAQPNINFQEIKSIELVLPELPEQQAIASVLSSLDDKIDLLHRQNKTLEAMAASLFRQWFVEEAQEDWVEVKLGDFFPVVTGKKDANFSTDDGEYPFFTCSQVAIKAPSFSFDGAAILLSGNGDFNVKRYIGKFEAYQRTYVLIPYDVKYFSFLFTLMRYYLSDITGGHQGSVINFITKGMITDFTFSLPKDRGLISEKLEQFNEIYEKVDSNMKQIRTLEKLRDNLLPKLMSGDVRVV